MEIKTDPILYPNVRKLLFCISWFSASSRSRPWAMAHPEKKRAERLSGEFSGNR
jgi:hypothetical protein